uniref:SdhC n=1 Tax=Gracilaria firma TaxID=2510791 RepID=A0A1W6C6Z6_9FLOR|nr:SdhC [Gracilaria changii]ARJ60474.1 SdhC [Gracilaria changii]ART65143.1 SdhC [Gracilaria changii]
MYNRPMSPHITIYASQSSSLASIWHRISGIFLALLVVLSFICMQLLIHTNSSKGLLIFELIYNFLLLFYNITYLVFLFCLFYHTFTGLKHVLWDLGFFLNSRFSFIFLLVISFCICLIILLLIFT